MTNIFKPTIYIDELGELGVLPDGGVINAGGVEGPNFTIGGQAVVLVDGTASDGSGPVPILGVVGYEHIQNTPSTVWTANHNKNSKKVQVTIWDQDDEQILADVVKVVNTNTVTISFNTAIIGRAILMMF